MLLITETSLFWRRAVVLVICHRFTRGSQENGKFVALAPGLPCDLAWLHSSRGSRAYGKRSTIPAGMLFGSLIPLSSTIASTVVP